MDFGQAESRAEGHEKVTGEARYAADIHRPNTLWVAYKRSHLPHARIVSVNTEAAARAAGVHAVLTGRDVQPARFGRRLMDWPVLAWDRVRFVGDRVAAVAAQSLAQAANAAALIEVEYEELPAVLSPEAALIDGAVLIHDDRAEYRYLGGTRPPVPHPNMQGYLHVTKGEQDLERAFAHADHVFEHTFTAPRQHQGHLEPHACVVWIDATDGIVHVVSTNKTPFLLQQQMAATIGVAPSSIDVECRFIGGDFGGKGLSLDECICYFFAKITGRPVKAVMDYAEELQFANPRHAAVIRLRTGVDHEGRFVAHQSSVIFDGGAYAAGKAAPHLVLPGGLAALGSYYVPNSSLEVATVYTNTVPGGHMRAPGEPQVLFASESHVDLMATALGIDPMRLRLRNALSDGQTAPNGHPVHAPRAREVLQTLSDVTNWPKPKTPGVGRGIAIGVRRPGEGKSAVLLSYRGGCIDIRTGSADQGVGTHTVIARVAAAVLSVSLARVQVSFGSTLNALPDAGAGASRATYLNSRAVEAGAAILRSRLEQAVAERHGIGSSDVSLLDDHFVVRSDGGVRTIAMDEALPDVEIVDVVGEFDSRASSDEATSSFAGYVVEVHVDRETGQLTITDATLVVDVGTVINPTAHQGQLYGGFVYGLGCSTTEEILVQDGRITTVGLEDYRLPTTKDVPPLRTILLAPAWGDGAYGAKMVGELVNSAVGPALANAVFDAVGVRLHTLPITAERIYAALSAHPLEQSE